VDSLAEKPSVAYDMVLSNPPFGKKSSITVINEEGDESKEALTYVRDDFWATTSYKQLNKQRSVHGHSAAECKFWFRQHRSWQLHRSPADGGLQHIKTCLWRYGDRYDCGHSNHNRND